MSEFGVPQQPGEQPPGDRHLERPQSAVDAMGFLKAPASQLLLDPAHASAHLRALDEEVHRMQRQIRLQIQARLEALAGCTMRDTHANQDLVRQIHAMLERNGLRVRCPECGHPAILRVSPRSGAQHGVFVFDHTIDGRRTFHGGRGTLPILRLVVKPPRASKNARAG